MLNSEQQRAVEAVRGPVCILAGAGSGKTTTITHRVANQVESRAFRSDEILAVSFTAKAAGEMRARLDELGVPGVRCSTFHSAALGQLRFFAAEPPKRILASKALPLRHIGNSLRRPYRFRPAADLATEVEWAKNRRIAPDDYMCCLRYHETTTCARSPTTSRRSRPTSCSGSTANTSGARPTRAGSTSRT